MPCESELQLSCKMIDKLNPFDMKMESMRIKRSSKIIKEIDDGILGNEILKKMAGHFYLKRRVPKELESNENEIEQETELELIKSPEE